MSASPSRIRWGGLVLIALSLFLYIRSVLYADDREPLQVLGFLILLPIGLYFTVERGADLLDAKRLMQVRLNGPGKPGTPERAEWARAQTQRGRSVLQILLTVLLAALALFVSNHITGSIKTSLNWESHRDRQGQNKTYKTEAKDSLATVAAAHRVSPVELGIENPFLKLTYGAKNPPISALSGAPLTSVSEAPAVKEITLESAALRLKETIADTAAGFATTSLAAGQNIEIPSERPYDPRQWVDWLLWTLIGAASYLLIEAARHLRNVVTGDGDFLGETTWYWTQLATGPLIAFVILLLFTHIDVDLLTGDESAVEVNLHQYPLDLLLVPAFLLGFYSRVTREVLDSLMRRIFGAAWRAANGDFDVVIKGSDVDDEIASEAIFETKPPTPVVWSATDGTITPGGIFRPPVVDRPKPVFVTAVATGSGRAVTKAVTAVRHKFQVQATGNPDGTVRPGQSQILEATPLPETPEQQQLITWELVAPVPKGVQFVDSKKNGPKVSIQVPADVLAARITIRATYAGLSRDISLNIVPA